jgi:nitrate reductase NapE component
MPDSESKNLNPLSIFTGFIPWIAFTLTAQRLAADGVAWSALLAAVLGLVFVVRGRRTGSPTQMDIYSLILFTVIAVVGFIGDHGVDVWLYEWGRPLVGVVLGLTVLATSSIRPFTAEYAKQSTPREYWDSPLFRRINFVLSAAWGVAITAMGAAAVLVTALDAHATGTDSPYLLDFFLNWVVPIGLIVWMIHFTNTYPDRAGRDADEPEIVA